MLKTADVMRFTRLRPIRVAVTLLLLALLAGCSAEDYTLFHAADTVSTYEGNLTLIVTLVMLVFVFLPVLFVALFFAWRYRASNTNAAYSPKWDHSTLLEVFLWGGPILICIVFAVMSVVSNFELDPYKMIYADNDKEPVKIEAIAMDWKWLFIYPDEDVASINEMAVPVDTPISIDLTSDTVMTSFFVPTMGSQIYAMSGMRTKLHLLPHKKGEFFGKNFQYTGEGYAQEEFKVLSMSDDDFADWIENAKEEGEELDEERFDKLAVPSKESGAEYFHPVKDHMLRYVIGLYHEGKPRNQMTRSAER